MVKTWSRDFRIGFKCLLHFQQRKEYLKVSGLAGNLIQNREVNRAISFSIIELVENTPQVQEVITVLLLDENNLYCKQLRLFNPAYQIPRLLISRCIFSNLVIKEVLFGLSNCKEKEELVRVLSSLSVSFWCSFTLIIPSSFGLSNDCNSLCMSSPVVSNRVQYV